MLVKRKPRQMRCSEASLQLVKEAFSTPYFPLPDKPTQLYGVALRVDDTVLDYAVETYDQKGKLMEVTDLRHDVSVKVGGDYL